MAQHRLEDRYTNLATANVVESAANTITFVELLTGISLGQGTGMLIDQIDYYPTKVSLQLLAANPDTLHFGWFTSNASTGFNATDRRIIHHAVLNAETVIGTAASAMSIFRLPLQFKFSPPIIVAAPRLYLGVSGTSLSAAANVESRLYFRYIPLTDKEYLELAETFILVG